jgi:hypothetical protein
MELLIKLPRHSKKIDQAKTLIIEKINWLQTQPDFKRVFVTPDVDCV